MKIATATTEGIRVEEDGKDVTFTPSSLIALLDALDEAAAVLERSTHWDAPVSKSDAIEAASSLLNAVRMMGRPMAPGARVYRDGTGPSFFVNDYYQYAVIARRDADGNVNRWTTHS